MKKLRLLPLLLICVLAFTTLAPSALALDDPDVGAKSIILADMQTGEILFARNENESVSPASLTKIMTVMMAIEAIEAGNCTLDEVIVAPDDCLTGMDEMSSTSGIVPGESLTMENLLYCSMLGSANEACNILASHLAGSISAFCEQMNMRAAQLGCTSTVFVDPNGLSSNDKSTARDFYLITKAAAEHELFLTICDTTTYIVPVTNKSAARTLNNSNALISPNSIYAMDGRYLYEPASGIKTGYTSAAGYCLISTAAKEDKRLVAIVMGAKGPNNTGGEVNEYRNFADTITLYDWAFDNFSYQTILPTSQSIYKADVEFGAGDGTVNLRPQSDVTMLVPNDFDMASVTYKITLQNEKLVAPIAAGTVLATADVMIDGEVKANIKLVNIAAVEISRIQYIKQRLETAFASPVVRALVVIIVLFLAAYIAMVIRYRSMRKKHIKQRRLAEKELRAQREQLREQSYGIRPDEPTSTFTKLDAIERDDPTYETMFDTIGFDEPQENE